jgi:type IV secretion system protein VirB6
MGIASEVEASVDALLSSAITSKSAAFCDALIPIAIVGVSIYLATFGFAIMRGEANNTMQTVLWKCFRISLIAGLALSVGTYHTYVVEGTSALEVAYIQTLSPSSTTVGALIDDLDRPFVELGSKLWQQGVTGFWPNYSLLGGAALVAIAQFILFAISLGFYLLAKVGLSLVLAVGPVFVLCAMWPATEKYTESWLGQVLNYVFIKVLVAACLVSLTAFASQYAAHIEENTDAINVIKSATSLILCAGALAVIMLNLPQLASALTGGASISGIGRTIGRGLLDLLNKPGRQKSPPPKGGDIKPVPRPGEAGSPPSPRQPLYNRNTIERLRNLR